MFTTHVDVNPSQTEVNCNPNVCERVQLYLRRTCHCISAEQKINILDAVKPRIDCGFGEGNIVAHVGLPGAEAYQCFYT